MSTTPATPIESSAPPAVTATPPAALAPTPAEAPAPTPGAAEPVKTPAAVPAATEPTPAPAGDFSDLLAEDLKPIAVEAAAAGAADDLAVKYKDDPAVQALIAEKAVFAPIAEVLKGNRYEIPNPQELKLQLEDSNVLYDIAAGKKPASSLLQTMLSNPAWSQEQKNAVLADIAQFVSKATGQPIAASAAGIEDPAMAEIKKIRAEQAAEKEAANLKVFTERVATGKKTLTTKVNDLLTGTWLEGEGDYIFSLVGGKFDGDEKAMEVIAAAERGDYTQLQKALQAVKNEEATRHVARNKRLIEMKKKVGDTIPAQVAGGSPPAPTPEPGTNIVEMDVDKRRAAMLANYRSGQ